MALCTASFAPLILSEMADLMLSKILDTVDFAAFSGVVMAVFTA